jgi:predicted dehydrogenase
MPSVRIGVVGLGIMGSIHARYLHGNHVEGATLAAICSRDASKLSNAATDFPNIPTFVGYEDLLASDTCDAVLIVTPHPEHPAMVRAAFAHDLHVLVEKPLAVTLKAAQEIVAESRRYPHLAFGLVYNQRFNPLYQKIRELITTHQLGAISRISWLITNWFRTHAYYKMSPWRATWKGEGGGVLINQCLHNLDLLHWITGGMMPTRITAIATAGKTHPIEVEDEASAILEYSNGAIGHFATSTGEFPGTNRLEIAGSRGKLTAENNILTLTTTAVDIQEFNRTNTDPFGAPSSTTTTLTFPPSPAATAPNSEYQQLTHNFINVLQQKNPTTHLLAPGTDGPFALELANALILAGHTRTPVTLPLDPDAYESFLQSRTK